MEGRIGFFVFVNNFFVIYLFQNNLSYRMILGAKYNINYYLYPYALWFGYLLLMKHHSLYLQINNTECKSILFYLWVHIT